MPWWGVALFAAAGVLAGVVIAYLLYLRWAYGSFSHPGDGE